MKILSIQSWVASGHVGNAAALFPLQRLGTDVVAVHTVQFSNHPGHGAFTGRLLPAGEIAALVQGLDAHGALATCDAVLTGYLGDAALGGAVLDAVRRVRRSRPDAIWLCDPVIGDDGRIYVAPGIPEFFGTQAVPEADIVTPNQFELSILTGLGCTSLAEIAAAASELRSRLRADGPRAVLVTSLRAPETAPGALDMLLCCDTGHWLVTSPLLPRQFSGAGDTLAALFLHHVLQCRELPEAAQRAASATAGLLQATWQAGSAELLTVAAQDQFVSPPCVLPLRKMSL